MKIPAGSTDLCVTITSPRSRGLPSFCVAHTSFELYGQSIGVGLVRLQRPGFDASSPRHRHQVLLRIQGFSCNYRDRGITLMAASAARERARSFVGIGSDFVAQVEAVGVGVTSLRVGDRVIPDSAWFPADSSTSEPGIPTNQASSRFRILPADKLARIPDEMDTATAACFTIGAQTSYGMIRRLGLQRGERVLVTAAHSNTSLFVCRALQNHDVEVYATASSQRQLAQLKRLGVRRVFTTKADGADPWAAVKAFAAKAGEFDAVIDPFYDLNLVHAVRCLRMGGRYISCGYYAQHASMKEAGKGTRPDDLAGIMSRANHRNLSIMGNCLGSSEDLARAIEDHRRGRFGVVVDSSFPPAKAADFFRRTYDTRSRFGKVALVYEENLPRKRSAPRARKT